jgi:translation elongation factor EF-1alpha
LTAPGFGRIIPSGERERREVDEEERMADEEIGHIIHFFPKISVAVIEITAGSLKVGETIRIKGHTSDFTQVVESLQQEHLQVPEIKTGASAGLKVKEHVREGDKVLRIAAGA